MVPIGIRKATNNIEKNFINKITVWPDVETIIQNKQNQKDEN